MKKYAKIINNKTKEVSVALGGYVPDGFTEMDVEEGYNFVWYVEGYAPQKTQEVKEQEIRQVRNEYLVDFVDPYQLVIRWGELSETEQSYMKEYRQYLLDYTKEDGWWEQNPDDYQTWLISHHPVTGE